MSRFTSVLIRSVGIALATFIPGMALGAVTGDWLRGGLIGAGTVFSSIITFFGVQLAWDGVITASDIEIAFRAAVAKQAENNKDVQDALTQANSAEEILASRTPLAYAVPADPASTASAPAIATLAQDPYANN